MDLYSAGYVCVCSHSFWGFKSNSNTVSRSGIPQHATTTVSLTSILLPLLQWSLSLACRCPMCDRAFNTSLFPAHCSVLRLCRNCLQVHKELFLAKAETKLICEHKYKYLEWKWIGASCSFSKIIDVASQLISMSFLATGFWPCLYYQMWNLYCGMILKFKKKVIGYTHHGPTHMASVSTSYLAGQ